MRPFGTVMSKQITNATTKSKFIIVTLISAKKVLKWQSKIILRKKVLLMIVCQSHFSQVQLHRFVHVSPSLAHLHVRQPRADLHPHLIKSVHALAASG